jgi:chemotaxis protein MotA
VDIATVGGLIGGFVLVVGGIIIGGNSIMLYVDVVSFVIVILGSFASCVVSVPLEKSMSAMKYFRKASRLQSFRKRELVDNLVGFADTARKEGLLSLDDTINTIDDAFLKSGLRLVVDGTDPDVIKKVLYADISQIDSRHEDGIGFFEKWGSLAPAFGMIGTLIGLIGMMANLEDTASVGPNMAVALITTLYGSLFANLVLIPIKNKLEDRNKEEMIFMEIMVQGVLSIQSGENPNLLKEKLEKYLPPTEREGTDLGE